MLKKQKKQMKSHLETLRERQVQTRHKIELCNAEKEVLQKRISELHVVASQIQKDIDHEIAVEKWQLHRKGIESMVQRYRDEGYPEEECIKKAKADAWSLAQV